jgi:hypothetical protein
VQIAELAAWALAAVPAARRAQHAQHAAPQVLKFLTVALGALACTHEAVLGTALHIPHSHGETVKGASQLLRTADLSPQVALLALEHVVPVVLSPSSGPDSVKVRGITQTNCVAASGLTRRCSTVLMPLQRLMPNYSSWSMSSDGVSFETAYRHYALVACMWD